MPYEIRYAAEVDAHLERLTARQRAIVFSSVRRHLGDTPTTETRNRKPMRPNSVASWELRLGDLRVYYDVSSESEEIVTILAVGVKIRASVRIGLEIVDF